MLFSGKENVFMCLDVFQKIFRKIFFGVWKMLQGKDKPISTPDKTQIDAWRSRSRRAGKHITIASDKPITTAPSIARSRSTAPLRGIAIGANARSRSTARSREASIAISQAPRRSRSAWRQDRHLGSRSTALVLVIGADWSLVRANGVDWCSPSRERRWSEIANSAKCFAISLSLSLSLSGIHLKWK